MQNYPFKVLAAVLTVLVCGMARADVFHFTADLSGPAESPPNASPGTGHALVTYDDVAHTLSVFAEFQDLLGTTTVAHIHAPTAVPFAGAIGVATYPGTFPGFPAGVTSGTYTSLSPIDLTLEASFTGGFLGLNGGTAAGAEAGLFDALLHGRAYFNVHSSLYPGGEIRGFLVPIPDTSATAPLLAVGLLAIAGCARCRR
jgi:hypothetical protein